MANEGESATFTCEGISNVPRILQVNGNIRDPRLARISEADGGSGSGNSMENKYSYIFDNLTRADNGTVIQCFINAVPSNIITIIVDCEYVCLSIDYLATAHCHT